MLAHVPDINDFVARLRARCSSRAAWPPSNFRTCCSWSSSASSTRSTTSTISYLSLTAVAAHLRGATGCAVFDVEELPTHGGSLRVFAQRSDARRRTRSDAARATRCCRREAAAGVTTRRRTTPASRRAPSRVKDDFLRFLIEARRDGKPVAAYGAAAKGNTLLNFAGVRADLLAFVVDRNPAKQGKFLPGSRIPIVDEAAAARARGPTSS